MSAPVEEDVPRRVVVLGRAQSRFAEAVVRTIARALAGEGADEADKTPVPAGPDSRAPQTQGVLQMADAVVALDPSSLEHARSLGVEVVVAVLPGLDIAWAEGIANADCIAVGHALLAEEVIRRGAPRGRVVVTGIVPPEGHAPPSDRDALRRRYAIPEGARIVLAPIAALDDEAIAPLLVQLSLVAGKVTVLFDVGDDPEIAEMLRRSVPGHGIDARMFADGPDAAELWQLADVVLVRARGPEAVRALSVGAPLLVLGRSRMEDPATQVVVTSGVGQVVDALATLAVALDASLEPAKLAERRAAIQKLDLDGAARRVAECVQDAWRRRREALGPSLKGLPVGLERIRDEPTADGVRDSHVPTVPPGPGPRDDDMEKRIDAELEALKKRL